MQKPSPLPFISPKSGLTLTEVMLAMSIIGVIAVFTLPKIMYANAVDQRSLTIRETVLTLHQIMEEGMYNGDLSCTNFQTYFLKRMNALETCSGDSSTQGCWDTAKQGSPGSIGATEIDEPGLIMHNGASVVGFRNIALVPTDPRANGILVDWNGLKGPNTIGDDQLWLDMCYDTTRDCTGATLGAQHASGTIVPTDNANDFDNGIGPTAAAAIRDANVQLYKSVFP